MQVFRDSDCRLTLEELRPQVGRYGWLWRLVKIRSRQIGGVFPARLLTRLRPLCRKRYFVGRLADDTRFVGDVTDFYSVGCGLQTSYDTWLLSLLQQLATQFPGTVLDVGSNMGVVSAALGRNLGPERKIVAFEAVPDTALRAAATMALNDLPNVTVFATAVGASDGELELNIFDGASDVSTARPVGAGQTAARTISVPCRRLDSLLADELTERVGLVKLDVEGFERNAIEGAQQLIARDRPAIVYEYWPEAANELGWDISDLEAAIAATGHSYRFEAYDGGHDSARPVAYPPPSGEGIYNIVATPIAIETSGSRADVRRRSTDHDFV